MSQSDSTTSASNADKRALRAEIARLKTEITGLQAEIRGLRNQQQQPSIAMRSFLDQMKAVDDLQNEKHKAQELAKQQVELERWRREQLVETGARLPVVKTLTDREQKISARLAKREVTGRDPQGNVARRRELIRNNQGEHADELCETFDRAEPPLPVLISYGKKTWTDAYRTRGYKGKIDKMIAVDRKWIREHN